MVCCAGRFSASLRTADRRRFGVGEKHPGSMEANR